MISNINSSLFKSQCDHKVAAFIIALLLFSIPTCNSFASEPVTAAHDSVETEHEWQKNHAAIFIGGMAPVNDSKETSLRWGCPTNAA